MWGAEQLLASRRGGQRHFSTTGWTAPLRLLGKPSRAVAAGVPAPPNPAFTRVFIEIYSCGEMVSAAELSHRSQDQRLCGSQDCAQSIRDKESNKWKEQVLSSQSRPPPGGGGGGGRGAADKTPVKALQLLTGSLGIPMETLWTLGASPGRQAQL